MCRNHYIKHSAGARGLHRLLHLLYRSTGVHGSTLLEQEHREIRVVVVHGQQTFVARDRKVSAIVGVKENVVGVLVADEDGAGRGGRRGGIPDGVLQSGPCMCGEKRGRWCAQYWPLPRVASWLRARRSA
jgi:hypothetical protein